MLSIALGPVALPVAPLVLVASVLAGAWVARAVGGRAIATAGASIHAAAFAGVAAARVVHVAAHADSYAISPLSALDLRDGGWNAAAGLAACAAWLAWRAWRTPAARRALAAGAATALVAWGAGSWLASGATPARIPEVEVTELATGRVDRLAAFAAGRPAVVNLWASWCGPCRAEMPAFVQARQRNPHVAFLLVDQGEAASAVSGWLERERVAPQGVLLDPQARLGPAVGTRGLPTTLFYDGEGRLVDAHFGALNPAAIEVGLRAAVRAR